VSWRKMLTEALVHRLVMRLQLPDTPYSSGRNQSRRFLQMYVR
jgi:hypothetical protein